MTDPLLAASGGDHLELVVFGLLLAVAGLAIVARLVNVPYPILLVLGGLGAGFVPGMPDVELDPDIVLLIFLPPLLYAAAFFSNLHELRRAWRPISMLAIGLVAVTTVAVATVAHEVIGLSWPVAFVLGAVVSPTDAVAPAEIIRRLGVPRRVMTIIEGESLTNDWTALVTYKFAVAAVATGSFSLLEAGPEFIFSGIGGVAIGITVGVVITAVRRRIEDPPIEITISLLTAYAAYIPAEEIGASGVLAAVTTGVWLGWQAGELTTHTTRIQLDAIWEILQFLLNAFLFVLIGLQLPTVLDQLSGRDSWDLVGYGLLISGLVITVRIVWVFGLTWVRRRFSKELREDPDPQGWRGTALVAWAGMRGGVALAAALAIPFRTDSGAPFPERDLVIFLAFCVIFVTLVGQGLVLPALIKVLGIEDDGVDRDEELNARLETAFAALERIDDLADEDWVRRDSLDRVRGMYDYRTRRFASRIDAAGANTPYEDQSIAYRRLMGDVIDAQRRRLLELRNRGEISDEVRRRVQRDLDYEQARIEE